VTWLQSVGVAGRSGAGRRQEFIGRRKDGGIFDTDVTISRFQSGDEHLYAATIRDMTERKRVEQMKTEFVSTVSHELRTPLTSIGGSLGLLSAGAVGPLNEKAARLVEIAHNNCQRLIRLINDILDIEKIESGKMNFDLRTMALGPLIERTISANRGFAEEHSVTLKSEMPPWPIAVMGDPDRLEQLVTNLLSNAIKHCPSGGVAQIRVAAKDGHARIEVMDRGAGVPADFRDRIFRKFAMADNSDSRAKGGTGLGLAIVREIAEKHGGRAGFEDRDGGGAVFYCELPLSGCEDEWSNQSDGSLPVLLHIDDDRDFLAVVASAFGGRATVQSVSSLAEARDSIAVNRFAGAVVDVNVPPESGLDLVPALRDAIPGIPIVVFSALDDVPPTPGVDVALIKGRTSVATLVETTMALVARATKEAE
jgi:signal transduction histidine kinase